MGRPFQLAVCRLHSKLDLMRYSPRLADGRRFPGWVIPLVQDRSDDSVLANLRPSSARICRVEVQFTLVNTLFCK